MKNETLMYVMDVVKAAIHQNIDEFEKADTL